MKVAILYLHVVGKSTPDAPPPEHYRHWSLRFIDSYKKHAADDAKHDLIIVSCGGLVTAETCELFKDIATGHVAYLGGGWDIGAHQNAAMQVKDRYDFVICMATPTYFARNGFIFRICQARDMFGDGVYGPTASYENNPHIRTCCWAFDPKTFAQYPHTIDSREKTFQAESGKLSIFDWYAWKNLRAILVTVEGSYERGDWRKPKNIFRRGDQSNCFVFDRHSDIYASADNQIKLELERRADGKM